MCIGLVSIHQNVKNIVGRIPTLKDFIECNSVSPLLFIEKCAKMSLECCLF